MNRSVLLQLARDSIEEVIEAQNTINDQELLALHPLLQQQIPTHLKIFIAEELRGSCSYNSDNSLLESVKIAAKKAAFEDINFSPMSTSEYLRCSIEITLDTPEGMISQKDEPIIK